MAAIENPDCLVAVHDGVRPFITEKIITESFETASIKGCAITSVALKDSVRKVEIDGDNSAVDRTSLRIIQTPQTFQYEILKNSFDKAKGNLFTDDASVAEAAGFPIFLIEGAYQNIKITTPEDLLFAEAYLKNLS